MQAVAKITLDSRTFQALASSTRLSVLRALDERRKTLSELARDLELNKATVHEHLQLLTAAELVRKKDEGRKWIYYELTWTGTRILHPQETTTFNLLLGLGVVAAGGSFAALGQSLGWWFASRSLGAPETGGAGGETPPASPSQQAGLAADSSTASATSPPSTGAPSQSATAGPPAGHDLLSDGGLLALALLLAALAVLLGAWLLRRRLRGRTFQAPPGEPGPDDAFGSGPKPPNGVA